MIPKQIPSEMEYRNAIAKMQMKAGIASRTSSHAILATCCIMRKPTITSAGAVAKEGIARNRGEKNRDSRNRPPAAIAVRPVRPPSAIPEADSTKVVIVASAFCDTGSRLYESSDRGGSEASAAHCADSVGKESALDAGKFAFFVKEFSLSCASDQGSECIEHIDKQEREHDDDEVYAEHIGEVHLEERRSNGSGHGDDPGRDDTVEACLRVRDIEADQLADNAKQPCADDAQKDRTLDIAEHKDRGEQNADESKKYGDTFIIEGPVSDGALKGEYGYQCRTVHYDVRVLQADECDKEADTNGYGDLKGCRDRVEERFSDVGQGEGDEDQTFHEDSGQCHLPGISHSQYYGVGEVSVEAHTCGKNERQVRKECHQERGNCGCQSRCCKDRA